MTWGIMIPDLGLCWEGYISHSWLIHLPPLGLKLFVWVCNPKQSKKTTLLFKTILSAIHLTQKSENNIWNFMTVRDTSYLHVVSTQWYSIIVFQQRFKHSNIYTTGACFIPNNPTWSSPLWINSLSAWIPITFIPPPREDTTHEKKPALLAIEFRLFNDRVCIWWFLK